MRMLKVRVGNACVAHDASLSFRLEIRGAVDWDSRSPASRRMVIDVVAAGDSVEQPAAGFQELAHPLAGDGFHAAPSRFTAAVAWSCAAASQPSAASRRLARTSSSVA